MTMDLHSQHLIQSIYSPPLLKKKSSAKLTEILDKIYPQSQWQVFSLARHALKTGLSSLGLKKGDRVLIPSFICRDVLAPFCVLGLEVLYYSVGPDLQINQSVDDLPKAQAILVVHYFGLESDLKPFEKYCKVHGSYLIEDNAHGFLSESENGPLGTQGDLGIISLRKSLPVSNGALLLAPRGLQLPNPLPSKKLKSYRILIKDFLRPFVSRFGVGFLLSLTHLKRGLRGLLKGSQVPSSNKEDELHIPFRPNPIPLEPQLQLMDMNRERKRRRDLFNYFAIKLSDSSIQPLRKELSPFEIPYVFPFFCSPESLLKVESLINSLGSEIVKWPALPESIEKVAPEHYKNLYLVKFLW